MKRRDPRRAVRPWALALYVAAGGLAAASSSTATTASATSATSANEARAASAAGSGAEAPGTPTGDSALAGDLEGYLAIPSVAGRDEAAADFLASRLAGLPVQRDALGNVVVTIGSGEPRRLVVCPMDQPGFAVTRIEPDGYLRLTAIGPSPGALWDQAHIGHEVVVGTGSAAVPGAVAVRSVHLQNAAPNPAAPPLSVEDAYVDVGAESDQEAAELGVRLLDPVALLTAPAHLAHGLIAAPAAQVRAACVAALAAARRVSAAAAEPAAPGAGRRLTGSVVFAWTAMDLVNGAGLDFLLHRAGPFAAVLDLGWGFGWKLENERPRPVALAAPGSGVLIDGDPPIGGGGLAGGLALQPAPYADLRPRSRGGARWGSIPFITHLGLPALYLGSPVETVALADVQRLADALTTVAGLGSARRAGLVPSPQPSGNRPPASTAISASGASAATAAIGASGASGASAAPEHDRTAAVLGSLISQYGVSGAEASVRAAVARQLPPWAKPITDAAGNLIVVAGGPPSGNSSSGAPPAVSAAAPVPVVFMAHLDEVGFRVKEVLPDGRLEVERRGGVLTSVWEAQPALVQGGRGDVAGVFEARPDWRRAEHGAIAELTVFVGTASAAETADLGIAAGSTVTMPKHLLRLGRHRAVGRSMDDRVGSTALLLALAQLDPARLRRPLIFVWTTGEETGLDGATAIANRLRQGQPIALPGSAGATAGAAATASATGISALRLYPVDTFVSADSPLESPRFADAPLGHGPVLRAMDSSSYIPRPLVDRALRVAADHHIPIQVGRTGGATDGIPFISLGVEVLPLSWPGRYSHSPVEVSDFRDIENLVRLLVALAESPD